jgi:hypothetical protein
MTFAQMIAALNENTNAAFHIFAEYEDGKRGYYCSRDSLQNARRAARHLADPEIYDRNGDNAEDLAEAAIDAEIERRLAARREG